MVLDFIYTAAGAPFALEYYSTEGQVYATYYYITNYQGDVVALLDSDYDVVARYTYNAWGELVSVTNDQGTLITDPTNIAHLNPLRYRSYYYDTETGFYYLQSRYYDPTLCRFLNADSYASTGQGFAGYNMFAYCGNNPIKFCDEQGTRFNYSQMSTYGGVDSAPEVYWKDESIRCVILKDTIYITAYATISGIYDADQISTAIEQIWSGKYTIDGESINVEVDVVQGKSRYDNSILFIGVSGQERSYYTKRMSNGKCVPVVKLTHKYQLERSAAHEFGHCLGIDDYYNYTTAGHLGFDRRFNSIMNALNYDPGNLDILMVINSFRTGSSQKWCDYVP